MVSRREEEYCIKREPVFLVSLRKRGVSFKGRPDSAKKKISRIFIQLKSAVNYLKCNIFNFVFDTINENIYESTIALRNCFYFINYLSNRPLFDL